MATVDRSLAKYNADLASRAVIAEGLDAHLALIDPSENTDKYYILQGLEDPELEGDERYFSLQHWGRTGTAGDCKLEGPSGLEDVKARLSKVFKEKTGSEWGDIQPGDRAPPGKYWLQQLAKNDEKAVWEYYVGDGVDGKRPGWYPYTEDASAEVEAIYAQHEANERESRTAHRLVESGYFKYKVDLEKMTQENTKTNKVREIRRTIGQGEGSQPATEQDLAVAGRRAMKAMKAERAPPMKATRTVAMKVTRAAPMKVMKAATKQVMKVASARKKPAAKKTAMKAPMKTTRKVVKKKVMKKAMKVMKKSKIAKGKRARAAVWGGTKEKTSSGKKKEDLMKNKAGKIVSKKSSAAGRKKFTSIAKWVGAIKQARLELGITGFAAIKKGTALYDKAKELYPTATPIALE